MRNSGKASGALPGTSTLIIFSETNLRVPSSSTNRRPSGPRITAPTPRKSSAARVLTGAVRFLGSTKAVGCTWTWSMSMMAAPRSAARRMPSPVAKAPLVVANFARSGRTSFSSAPGAWWKPYPPVAMITALASTTKGSLVTRLRHSTPRNSPVGVVRSEVTLVFLWKTKRFGASPFVVSLRALFRPAIISDPASPVDGRRVRLRE
mmetsp:Transcript_15019/g.42573  ORF Transcript_15019/g.42573 Transcript_15019/m.42573 type:complete len:206 (+) Transcript_15019:1068-1685(+)